MQIAATEYMHAAYDLVDPLRRLSPFHEWPRDVAEALDAIGWYAGFIAAKIHRALHGIVESGTVADEDPIQNDWNGSAKAARLAIAECRDAWDALFAAGETPPDAPIRETRALLERIDVGLAGRFPRAMEFVRPGFDEPEVAAGALTSLAPFEPRRRSVGRRLRAWLSRFVRGGVGQSGNSRKQRVPRAMVLVGVGPCARESLF